MKRSLRRLLLLTLLCRHGAFVSAIRLAKSSNQQQDAPEAFQAKVNNDDEDLVHLLIYETERNGHSNDTLPVQQFINQVNHRLRGIKATLFGQGTNFDGFGSKISAVLPALHELSKKSNRNDLVVVSDGRDVLVNNPYLDDTNSDLLADEFRVAYDDLTSQYDGAIVISAEAQCCVSALTHAGPGSYFNADGTRNERACSSGETGCLWAGDDLALQWEIFMQDLMFDRTKNQRQKGYDDMFLNAGLIAGKVQDLIRVFEALQISNEEDDQAVLTDYMFRHPSEIVLDYQQSMFGNNRWSTASDGGCIFKKRDENDEASRLVHKKTNTAPLFIHSPGGFLECHDVLADALGVPAISQRTRRRLKQTFDDRRLQYGFSFVGGRTDDNVGNVPAPDPTPVTAPAPADVPAPGPFLPLLGTMLANTGSTDSSSQAMETNTSPSTEAIPAPPPSPDDSLFSVFADILAANSSQTIETNTTTGTEEQQQPPSRSGSLLSNLANRPKLKPKKRLSNLAAMIGHN